MGLFYDTVLIIRGKLGIIQQNCHLTDGVNHRADMKQFTHTGAHRLRRILTSCQFFGNAKQ